LFGQLWVNVGVTKENYGVLIFGKFVDVAKQLKPDYVSMITPSRWFTGGRGLEDFRTGMLNDDRLCYIKDFIDSKDCFPGVDISGGISYFLWDKKYNGDCTFDSVSNGSTTSSQRILNQFEIFPRYNDVLEIINKVKSQNEINLDTKVGPQTPFGFITTFRGKKDFFAESISLYTSGGISFVSRAEITKNSEWIDKYKVIFSKATSEHAGTPDKKGMYRVFSTIRILKPQEICTQSYLVGSLFDDLISAENFVKYLQTRFVRILILPTLTSQDLSKDKFQFVPLQNFTSTSDIDWSQSVADIDRQLYAKYGLSEEEVAFIEGMIKVM